MVILIDSTLLKMKKIFVPLIKYFIDKVKRSRFVQNLFEAPFDFKNIENFGVFEDSYGNKYELLEGLRSKIKPGWESMLMSTQKVMTEKHLLNLKNNGVIAVDKIIPVIKAHGKNISESTILEIGCHSGACSYTLANLGANKVIGTEFSGYKIKSIDQKNQQEDKLLEVNHELEELRNKLGRLYQNIDHVLFIDDDICNTQLEPESFDIICSWEVLEHLHDTEKAFLNIGKLLKEDGITILEYNPFFCLNGGHSLCTLDFLWGHVRLNETDFTRYIDEFRPNEKERAMSFFNEGLNRMTFYDLNNQLQKAGLEVISILPYTKEQHVRMVDEKILEQSKFHYPKLTLFDLVVPKVTVIAKKASM